MKDKSIRWITTKRIFDKTAGIGVFVGWDKKIPTVLVISLGRWGIILGPHTMDARGIENSD